MYEVKQDGAHYDNFSELNTATELAEELLGAVPNWQESVFTVENDDGYLLAAVTNRRIEGTFTKQAWGGRKNDQALFVDSVLFDATAAVLSMDHAVLMRLKDSDESSDELGRAHVQWDGPNEVSVVDEVLEYFGVDELTQITPEALLYARNRENPQPAQEQTITLSIKVKVRVIPGASTEDFVSNLDYSISSNTVGVVVLDTEVVDAS